MAREVWKVDLPIDDEWHGYPMAKIVHVACQYGALTNTVQVWFEATTDLPEGYQDTTHNLRVFGTGQPVPEDAEHVGTAIMAGGRLVWHVYVEVPF